MEKKACAESVASLIKRHVNLLQQRYHVWYSGWNAVAFLVVYCNSPESEFFVVDRLMKYMEIQ